MRLLLLAAALAALPVGASAQTATTERASGRAPWWMDRPIIASLGQVWTEVPANRASTSATYEVVDRDSAAATRAAADKVRTLTEALTAFGRERVIIATSFTITPLYEQYKDRQGEVNDNTRADKIERYQVSITINVDIRDARLAEAVYATLMSAKPVSTTPVSFRLEVDNETLTQMSRLAVEDARRRARLGAEAAGVSLGSVKLIDPTGRACQTDVLLTGAFDNGAQNLGPTHAPPPPPPPPMAAPSMDSIVLTASRRAAEVGLKPEDFRLPLQVPQRRLDDRACVVFTLG
ncbi:SIMPL domain-containing protein [Phenylobacterium immobile]|uniref:SIMPL domain-containing protein n=1 Tax=Phenylobacterium immobile TaxID=21 RepID=UPI000A518E45|nr:SIMPL domain-containing protein [Phenylobacterium immobile]